MLGNEKLDIYILFFSGVGLFTCLAGFIVYFVFAYRTRQIKNQLEKEAIEAHYQQEVLKTQLEVQEHTLNHVSREIHDNFGQVLSYLKLSLGTITNLEATEKQDRINESIELVSHVIEDLRDLSRSLSYETLAEKGFVETIRSELNRIGRSVNFQINFEVRGEVFELGKQTELVLFRIFQECIHNTIEHAKAKHLKISLQYSTEMFNLNVQDDGIGFCPDELKQNQGLGLKNMRSRAKLIGANISIESSPGKGCITTVKLDLSEIETSVDGQDPSSPGG